MGVNRPLDLPWKPYNKSSKYLGKCYNVYLLLLNFILNIPCFGHRKFLSSGYLWPSFLWLYFLGHCFCIIQFHAKVYPHQLLYWLSTAEATPSFPPLEGAITCPKTGIPREEYFYCHCQIYIKKYTQLHGQSAFDMLPRTAFSVTSTHQQKEIKVWRKKHTYGSIGITSGLSPLFFLSLSAVSQDWLLETDSRSRRQEVKTHLVCTLWEEALLGLLLISWMLP